VIYHADDGGSKLLRNVGQYYQITRCYIPEDSHLLKVRDSGSGVKLHDLMRTGLKMEAVCFSKTLASTSL
jgi:hypothetical protein